MALEIVYSLKPVNLSELRQILNGDMKQRNEPLATNAQQSTREV
jgi:hypothetical protein